MKRRNNYLKLRYTGIVSVRQLMPNQITREHIEYLCKCSEINV